MFSGPSFLWFGLSYVLKDQEHSDQIWHIFWMAKSTITRSGLFFGESKTLWSGLNYNLKDQGSDLRHVRSAWDMFWRPKNTLIRSEIFFEGSIRLLSGPEYFWKGQGHSDTIRYIFWRAKITLIRPGIVLKGQETRTLWPGLKYFFKDKESGLGHGLGNQDPPDLVWDIFWRPKTPGGSALEIFFKGHH